MNYVDTLQLIRRMWPTISLSTWEAAKTILDVLPMEDRSPFPVPKLYQQIPGESVTSKLILEMAGYNIVIDLAGNTVIELQFSKENRDHQALLLKHLREYAAAVSKPFPRPVAKEK